MKTRLRRLSEIKKPPPGGKLGEFFPAPPDEIIYAFLAQDLERLDMPPSQDADEEI